MTLILLVSIYLPLTVPPHSYDICDIFHMDVYCPFTFGFDSCKSHRYCDHKSVCLTLV